MNEIAKTVIGLQLKSEMDERSDFIEAFIPFIVNCVSKTTGRYIDKEDSDEFSIGMSGFNEAINKYDPEKGTFIGFSELVIRSRVTDYMRKEMKHKNDVELDEQILIKEPSLVNSDLAHEIRAFKEKLSYFELTMEDLTQQSPKHKETRREIDHLGQRVAVDDPICHKLYRTKKLPMAEIILKYRTTKKRLKAYRGYIIGIIIVFRENLDEIKGYIKIRGGSDE